MRQLSIFFVTVLLAAVVVPGVYADAVVGDGTPASCTNAALQAALDAGGVISFNCGGVPVTIPITTTLFAQNGDFFVDGGNLITLQGTPGVRIFDYRSGYAGSNDGGTLRLVNMTIRDAYISGSGEAANGSALRIRNQSAAHPNNRPVVYLVNTRFINNVSVQSNPAARGFDFGGAVYVGAADLYVYDSVFQDNRAEGGAGGAIHVLVSNLYISGSTFTRNGATVNSPGDNESGFGGAIYVDGTHPTDGPDITILDSTFEENNAANYGGFAYINLQTRQGGVLTIERSRFIGNSVTGGVQGYGGALSGGTTFNGVTSNPNDIIIRRSLFANNRATSTTQGGDGGAIGLAQSSDLTIENSIFTGNVAENLGGSGNPRGRGGAISHGGGSLSINHATIINNVAGWRGGGIFESDTSAQLNNSIIAYNQNLNQGIGYAEDEPNCNQAISGGNNIQYPESVNCTNGITIADPLLVSFDSGVVAPINGGPTIDNANGALCLATDYLGVPRPQGSGCEIGAVEIPGISLIDVNNDGFITPVDVVRVQNNLGTTNPTYNIDGVGEVTQADIEIVLTYLGQS